MSVATNKHADKRTAEQRANDLAQEARPKCIQDTTYVTTGPATGKEDERDDKPSLPAKEDVPVTVEPHRPAGGITSDAGNGPGVGNKE